MEFEYSQLNPRTDKPLPQIRNVFLITTHKCNLACKYCFVSQNPSEMPLQVALDSIDYLVKNNDLDKETSSVCFFGGEPMLRWSDLIVPTILYKERMYPDKNIKFSITTNCTLLDDEKIEFITKHNIGILTSIDGNKETQDFNRPFHNGVGSFDIVKKNIDKLLDRGRRGTFRSTVYPPTCGKLYENYLYAISLGYESIFFINDSFCKWTPEEEKLCDEQKMKIAQHYVESWRKNNKAPIMLSAVEKCFGNIVAEREREKNGLPKLVLFSNSKCGYGQSAGGAISTNGDIYGCQEMTSNDPLFRIGNIYTGLNEEKRKELARIFDEDPVKRGDMPCEECPACSVCNGGCLANNYMQTGKFNTCSHGHCLNERQHYKMACYIIDNLSDNQAFLEYLEKSKNKRSGRPKILNTGNPKDKTCSERSPSCGWCQECQSYLRFKNKEEN